MSQKVPLGFTRERMNALGEDLTGVGCLAGKAPGQKKI